MLLPTPTATYGGGSSDAHLARKSQTFDGSVRTACTDLRMVVEECVVLLPTPTARDWKDGPYCPNVEINGLLGRVAWLHDRWQKYTPAIDRHVRCFGRDHPSPVEPNKTNKMVLSPAFVEWMMCLPDGWVTDLPIARTNQLKILGNGVVPPQAAHAFDHLFRRFQ